MPFLKPMRPPFAPWAEADRKAQKNGWRQTIFNVDGSKYIGEWADNEKNGKGVQYWRSGAQYSGDWKYGQRHGYGTLQYPPGDRRGRIRYTGFWKNNLRHGRGIQFYKDSQSYEGDWADDYPTGWGQMVYIDGSTYHGEWLNGGRHGYGILCYANGNRYEGEWQDDQKEGHGRFYHVTSGQVLEGSWAEGVARCGKMSDSIRGHAPHPTPCPIPQCYLINPDSVLQSSEKYYRDLDLSKE